MPKKRLNFWNKDSLICAALASLLGTYSDLYFVGKGLYRFPQRILPDIFSINIIFTLIVLPVMTVVFLYCLSHLGKWQRACMILIAGLLMPLFEQLSERLGLFAHTEQWMHLYSYIGYLLFFAIIPGIYFALRSLAH